MNGPPVIMLTGARGRIGQTIKAACSSDWNLRAYSRTAGDGYADLGSLLEGRGALQAQALIHCAWSTVPSTSEENPGASEHADLPLVEKLIQRLQQDPAPPLLVFMSTGAVYGLAPGRPSREDDPPCPLGAYARGKLAAENLLRASKLPVCILRVGNIYSLSSTQQDAQGVVARLLRCALNDETFVRWGSDSIKDYLHRCDFLAALRSVVARRLTGTWNLGSGSKTSLSTLIALVEKASGRRLAVVSQPAPPWDVTDNQIDVSRLREALAWEPRITLEEGIQREVTSFRNHHLETHFQASGNS